MFNKINIKSVVLMNLFAFFCASQLTGCNQASAYQNENGLTASDDKIPTAVVKNVRQTFQAKFVYGDWRFEDARVINNSINAFIQIPDKLDMSKEQQQNYINQMICPAQHQSEFWQQVSSHEIWVHLYTHDKRYTVYSKCQNPNLSA